MPYVPFKKGTLLIPSGAKNGLEAKHLFGILTDRCAEGQHLLVGVTTLYPDAPHDPACIMAAGEHRFIVHDSYALYRMAQIQPAERLSKMVDGWLYSEHDTLSDELLTKLIDGVAASRFVPRYVKNYLNGL
jgi:hypothetical protein